LFPILTARFRAALILLVIGLASPTRADTLWYNGDFASNSFGVLNGINMTFEDEFAAPGVATVYDDFTVPSGIAGWHIDTVWSNDLMTFMGLTEATWAIRTDLSSGDAGTLIASGTGAATQIPTGRSLFEFTEFTVGVSGLAIDLVPGTYWLAVTPDGFGGAQSSLNSMTDGLNAIGTPPGTNGNAFLNSPLLNADFAALDDIFFLPDFSMGVAGRELSAQAVPEPGSLGVLALGLIGAGAWSWLREKRRAAGRKMVHGRQVVVEQV
jgi:hypothetical protein